jgi:hypothetical protein
VANRFSKRRMMRGRAPTWVKIVHKSRVDLAAPGKLLQT